MDPISARMVMAAAGAGAAAEAVYVEDVFNTFLYEGDATARTITNGIDLAGEGGMVWIKGRTVVYSSYVFDTERGTQAYISTDTVNTEIVGNNRLSAFNNNGFDLGIETTVNQSGQDFASWTFRKAPGFFDVVTYTGNGTAGRTVAHNLGSAPGMIWVKRTSGSGTNWAVYHRSQGATKYGILNTTAAFTTSSIAWNDTEPTATEFTVGTGGNVNASGSDFVAYIFAHDDARFGPSSNESIVKCGTYTGNGSTTGPVIDLGWEPQWVIIKNTTAAGGWAMFDTARGVVFDSFDRELTANTTNQESGPVTLNLTPTGFALKSSAGNTNTNGAVYIYMAIRRPDKAPAAGTDFFQVRTRVGDNTAAPSSIDFNADLSITRNYDATRNYLVLTRGLPDGGNLHTNLSDVLATQSNRGTIRGDIDSTVTLGSTAEVNNSGLNYIDYFFKRARGAFDIVFYTGNGTAGHVIDHGLGAVPQMIWVKSLDDASPWNIYSAEVGNTGALRFDNQPTATSSTFWNDTSPSSTQFTLGNSTQVNTTNNSYVAYVFGNVSGVIDFGSYTGNGTSQQIDCGFSAGARFVLTKSTTRSSNDWNLFDTTRGIVAGIDDRLQLQSDVTQNTAGDNVDPYSPGFEVQALSTVNDTGETYIYMAIA